MFDITIEGTSYPLRFGMGFLKELNGDVLIHMDEMPEVEQRQGLNYAMAKVYDGDIEELEHVIFLASKTETPRLSLDQIDRFLESDETDIDEVFKRILGFFETANVSKKAYKDMLERIEAKKKELAAE